MRNEIVIVELDGMNDTQRDISCSENKWYDDRDGELNKFIFDVFLSIANANDYTMKQALLAIKDYML